MTDRKPDPYGTAINPNPYRRLGFIACIKADLNRNTRNLEQFVDALEADSLTAEEAKDHKAEMKALQDTCEFLRYELKRIKAKAARKETEFSKPRPVNLFQPTQETNQ